MGTYGFMFEKLGKTPENIQPHNINLTSFGLEVK